MKEYILVINPGSTSTKVALYDMNQQIIEKTIRHPIEEISQFKQVQDQKEFRKNLIDQFLIEQKVKLINLKAVVGRGGLLKPIPSGTYLVNQQMLTDLTEEKYNTHASNLGAILANEYADGDNILAYIVDPVVVDELAPLAKISGLKGIERRSVGHALNQKAVARQVLSQHKMKYEESNLVVVHIGGGISIAAHEQGKMVEMVNGLDGEGPFSPERTGELPLLKFAEMILEQDLSMTEIKEILAGKGGLKSYLCETDIRLIEQRIADGDLEAKIYLDAMCYQIAKYIGLAATVLKGKIDFIILTGGVSYSKYVTDTINDYIKWIAPIKVIPGENEMEALFEGVKRVIDGVENAKTYD